MSKLTEALEGMRGQAGVEEAKSPRDGLEKEWERVVGLIDFYVTHAKKMASQAGGVEKLYQRRDYIGDVATTMENLAETAKNMAKRLRAWERGK